MTEEFLFLHNFMQFYASTPKKLENFSKNYGYFAKNSERRKKPLAKFSFECYSFTCKKKQNLT